MKRDRRMWAGAILVGVGLVLLGLQLMEGVQAPVWLMTIGSLLIAGYLMRRAYGLLVAGCIVLGIALGQVAEQLFSWPPSANGIGLGAGFLAIYVIDWAQNRSAHWWPLIPGTILVLSSVATLTSVGDYLWPLVLIVVGIGMMFGVTRRRASTATRLALSDTDGSDGADPDTAEMRSQP
jgi:hypothetical protein